MKIRQGRKVGRTLYRQVGPEPSDEDPIIGLVDSRAYARLIVEAVNAYVGEAGLTEAPPEPR